MPPLLLPFGYKDTFMISVFDNPFGTGMKCIPFSCMKSRIMIFADTVRIPYHVIIEIRSSFDSVRFFGRAFFHGKRKFLVLKYRNILVYNS